MSACLVYVTTADLEEARSIGRELVNKRLVACANIIPTMLPIFWWEGEVQEAEESVLLLKTTDDLVPAVITAVKALHSYDCPCVVALPIAEGNPAFLQWIEAETADSRDRH